MMGRLGLSLVFGALIAPLMSGCLNLNKSNPERRFYVLEAVRPETAADTSGVPGLRVRGFRISPLFEGRPLVYRTGEVTYASDFYNAFFVSPGPMITEQTARWLGDAGLFGHVVNWSARLESPFALEGSVTALYGDATSRASPRAVLEVQFMLTHDTGGTEEMVFHRDYRRAIPIRGTDGEALVKGWDEALAQILTEFETDLRSTGVIDAAIEKHESK